MKVQAPILLLLGLYTQSRKKDFPLLLLSATPIAATFLLAASHRYPVAVRLWLFLTPVIILTSAIGIGLLWRIIRMCTAQYVAVSIAFLAIALILTRPTSPPVQIALDTGATIGNLVCCPAPATTARTLVSRIVESCDDVYIAARGVPSWFFLSDQLNSETSRRFERIRQLFRADSPAFGDAEPSLVHFPSSADSLQLQLGCQSEIYGFASGTPNRSRLSQARTPVLGWAENEINRIAARPGRSLWLYLGETGLFESKPLLEELKRRHYRATFIGIPPRSGALGYPGLFVYRVEK